MSDDVVELERSPEGVLTLRLNRPERRNAINEALVHAWADALEDARTDEEVRVIVVTGAGSAFCAGGDFTAIEQGRDAVAQKAFLFEHVFRVAKVLQDVDKPVIAMINGPAMGAGLDMALLCDLRFAAEDAKLGEAYIKVGVTAGDGGAWLLPRLVGVGTALDLLWTGRTVSGQEALSIGLVDRVFPSERLHEETFAYARQLAAGPQAAIRITKRAVYQAMHMDLRSHIDQMSSHMAVLRQTDDYREGLTALQERREPRFGKGGA